MKKIIVLILAVAMLAAVFTGCLSQNSKTTGRFVIISTIFPGYDFAKQIVGTNAEVIMLLPPGAESHSYEPTPQDIIRIQKCDLFIYVGGESDQWVSDILSSFDNPVRTIKMMDCVNVVKEEIIEGMDHGHDDEHEHEDEHGHDDEHEEVEYDEHVWTSPANAKLILKAISDAICEADADYIDMYRENTNSYLQALDKLDNDFKDFFATVTNKTLIFGDRFPFRYFVDAYGLDYYAAFPGCATQSEPSAATIAFLIDKVKAEGISTVFHIEFSNRLVADSIAEATGAKTALLHTCHNVTKSQLNDGVTYISLMEQNMAALKNAMN